MRRRKRGHALLLEEGKGGAPRPAPPCFLPCPHPPACLRSRRAPWGSPSPQTKSRPERGTALRAVSPITWAELHRQKQGQGVPQRSPCRLQLASQAAPGPRAHSTGQLAQDPPRGPVEARGPVFTAGAGDRSQGPSFLCLSFSSCPLCPRSALASGWVTGEGHGASRSEVGEDGCGPSTVGGPMMLHGGLPCTQQGWAAPRLYPLHPAAPHSQL